MEEIQKFHTVRGYQLLEQNKKLLTSAMEDYLEMIYRNSLVEGYMRINILSELLNVQAPSVTKMVQKLHGITATTLHKISIFNKFIENNPEIMEKYNRFSQDFTGY